MSLRRIGPDPHLGGAQTPALAGCPDIFELENGDFAIVGRDVTSTVKGELPPGATCGPDERIIAIPRKTLVSAKPHIPENLQCGGEFLTCQLKRRDVAAVAPRVSSVRFVH